MCDNAINSFMKQKSTKEIQNNGSTIIVRTISKILSVESATKAELTFSLQEKLVKNMLLSKVITPGILLNSPEEGEFL